MVTIGILILVLTPPAASQWDELKFPHRLYQRRWHVPRCGTAASSLHTGAPQNLSWSSNRDRDRGL